MKKTFHSRSTNSAGLLLALTLTACATNSVTDQKPVLNPLPEKAAVAQPDVSYERASPTLHKGNDSFVNMPAVRPAIELTGDAVALNFEQAPLTEVVHAILGDIL